MVGSRRAEPMETTTISLLADWESFYVIVGSSAAVLTGLQFVVIALVREARSRSSIREIDAWGTPTIVHFCAVLLISAILSAPWMRLSSVALALGACAAGADIYQLVVIRRARASTLYRPVLEDWIWHIVLPAAGYTVILIASMLLERRPEPALFTVGAASLLLLFAGVHNAWDSVTYIAVGQWEGRDGQ